MTLPRPHGPHRPHRVAVLALPGVVAFELGLPHRFFTASAIDPGDPGGPGDERRGRPPSYEVVTITLDDGPVMTSADYQVIPSHPNTALSRADTIVIPGITPISTRSAPGDGTQSPQVAALLATARPEVRWVSICTGAFVLAAAGLLDGLPATTHWAMAAHFRTAFPRVEVDVDVLYVDNGRILTSAGNAAGIDLLLHILRRDLGSDVANRVARGAVVAPWRAGGQAQFIERPVPDVGDDGTAPARAWVLDHLADPVTLDDLARRSGMSVRTFTRRFREETGETAGTWLLRVRVDHARHLLETSDLAVDQVAERSGFGTSASLRHHLTAAVGMPPLAYRRTYRAETA